MTLGLHTLTAAAFGQIFSDLSGVMFGGTVEAMVAKMGLKPPAISPAQRLLPAAKLANTGGMAIGVVLGCLIGMTSLLFMDLDKNERLRREEELDTIVRWPREPLSCHCSSNSRRKLSSKLC